MLDEWFVLFLFLYLLNFKYILVWSNKSYHHVHHSLLCRQSKAFHSWDLLYRRPCLSWLLTIMMIKHPQVHVILTVNLRLLKKSLHCHPLISKKWLLSNLSFQNQYIIQNKGDKKWKTHQSEGVTWMKHQILRTNLQ